MSELPKWNPTITDVLDEGECAQHWYENYQAAIARLRVAEMALQRIAARYDWNEARNALAEIGPLP